METTNATVSNITVIENEERAFALAEKKSQAYATSQMIPAHLRDTGSMMILNQMSKDYNLPALTLAQNIFMIKGKIGMSGQLVIALINKSGIYDFDLEWEERTKPWGVRAIAYKNKRKVEGIWVDEQMIIDNGWYANSNWKNNKALMSRYRSATYFGRLNCPAILMGLQTDDELIDVEVSEPYNEETTNLNKALTENSTPESKPDAVKRKVKPKGTIPDIVKTAPEDAEVKAPIKLEDQEPIQMEDEEIEITDFKEEPVAGEEFFEETPVPDENGEGVVDKDFKEEPKVRTRASQKVASFYPQFIRVGVRRSHLAEFVRFHGIDDANIEEYARNARNAMADFYAYNPKISPSELAHEYEEENI